MPPTTDRQKHARGRGYTYYIAANNTRFQHNSDLNVVVVYACALLT